MKTTFTVSNSVTTDALFRSACTAISNGFTAVGVPKTADTGQIDIPTAVLPASGAYAGYEIRQFSDSMQTDNPIYLKIEYGCPSSANTFGLRVTAANGTDGSGTLTGNISFATKISGSGTANNYLSAGEGYVCLGFSASDSGIGGFFYIARTNDGTGATTADGSNVGSLGIFGNRGWQYLPSQSSGLAVFPATPLTAPCCIANGGAARIRVPGKLSVFPALPFRGYPDNPDMAALAYYTDDFPQAGITMNLSLCGQTHSYLALGPCSVISSVSLNGSTGWSIMMRYE